MYGAYTINNPAAGENPFGRSQTSKSGGLRQPAAEVAHSRKAFDTEFEAA